MECVEVCVHTLRLGISCLSMSNNRFYEVLGIQTFSFGGLPGQEVETSGGIKGYFHNVIWLMK
jgi:hypothetical protein